MHTTLPVNSDERYEDVAGMSYLAIDQYYRELAWIEPLAKEEEERLLDRVARAKRHPENALDALSAQDARDRLVELYQPLVLRIAKRQMAFFRSMELLDLVNEGSIGLLEAIDRYSDAPRFHGKFVTFAALHIRDALWKARTECDVTVVLPGRVQSLLSKMRKASHQFEVLHHEPPSSTQLASLLGVSEDHITEAEYLASRQYASSVEQLAFEGSSAEEQQTFLSVFQAEVLKESGRQVQLQQAFEYVLQHELTTRERQIVEMRYGLCEDYAESLKEVASRLGLSPAVVSQLYCSAMKRLQALLEPLVTSSEKVLSFFPVQEYYLSEEVAALLGVSKATVQLYARRGELPVEYSEMRLNNRCAQQRMLFPKQAIDALLASSSSSFPGQDYYTTEEVAALFQVKYVTVRRRAVRGELPVERRARESGRQKMLFPKQAIDALLVSASTSDTLPDLIA